MPRLKIKKEKVRVCINLDKEIYEKSGLYIENLSAFLNKCLKNQIEREEQKEVGSPKDMLCYNQVNKNPIFDKYSPEELQQILSTNWTK